MTTSAGCTATSWRRAPEIGRRRWLRMAARLGSAVGAVQLIGCSGDTPTSPSATATDTTTTTTTTTPPPTSSSTCSRVPEETAGPYPRRLERATVLSTSGVVRSDLRSSFGGLSGTADGVPLTVVLTIVSSTTCAPLAGRAVYLWHCDRPGRYSLYSSGVTNQNYLRGVQEADASGRVTFTTVFPGCYFGPVAAHSLRGVPGPLGRNQRRKQSGHVADCVAQGACDAVYATSGYESSVS